MGGGVMRTASKVAGVGFSVVNSGLRGVPTAQPVEQSVAAASGKATLPLASIVSSAKIGDATVAVQRPSWELDDWEFACAEEELSVVSGEQLPRVVFGSAPTLQEAKEATSELKDALDQLYLSPSRSVGSGVEQSGLLQNSESDHLESNKACVAAAVNAVTPLPSHALQAFKYLKETPAAQNVVASIASDPNVWNAVMQNEALLEFLKTQKSQESVANTGFQDPESPKSFEASSDAKVAEREENWFESFISMIKLSLAEMVGNVFGQPAVDKPCADSYGSGEGQGMMKVTLGASLTGLAVMVIMLIVMKR